MSKPYVFICCFSEGPWRGPRGFPSMFLDFFDFRTTHLFKKLLGLVIRLIHSCSQRVSKRLYTAMRSAKRRYKRLSTGINGCAVVSSSMLQFFDVFRQARRSQAAMAKPGNNLSRNNPDDGLTGLSATSIRIIRQACPVVLSWSCRGPQHCGLPGRG